MPKPPTRIPREKKGYEVPAVKRALAILDSLNESAVGLTVLEVSRAHKMPYSTAFYLLETMEKSGYVQRDDSSKKYTVGYKLLAFREGNAARCNLNLRALAFPLMEELTGVTGLTCHLATLEKDEAVYIEKAEPTAFIRLNTWVGKRNSLHSTAVGKALLMFTPDDQVRNLLKSAGLTRKTDRTITSMDALLNDLEQCRNRGFAIDDGEDENEGCCVAAPVTSGEHQVVAALGLTGTVPQIDAQRREAIGKLVKNYARQISARSGHLYPNTAVQATKAVDGLG